MQTFDFRQVALGIGVVLAALILLFLVKYLVERGRQRRLRRLAADSGSDSSIFLSAELGQAAPPARWDQRLDNAFDGMVQRTGLELNVEQALGYICLAGVWIGGLLILWRGQIWLGLFGLFVGSLAVLITFWWLQSRHRRRLQAQLPDAFYLLARSLRAGLPLEQAIKLVGEEGQKPLSDEFKRCAVQIQLGMITPVALQMMANRIQLIDFNTFVSAVGVHRVSGGNLALVLDRFAAATRDRNEFHGYVRSATTQARVSAILIGVVGLLLLLGYAIFQPRHVQAFFASPWGWAVVATCLLLQLVTARLLFRIVRVRY